MGKNNKNHKDTKNSTNTSVAFTFRHTANLSAKAIIDLISEYVDITSVNISSYSDNSY